MSTLTAMKRVFSKFADFFRKERRGLAVFLALILVGALSFEAGVLFGGSLVSLPLVIEKPVVSASDQEKVAGVSDTALVKNVSSSVAASAETRENCPFVGSRNSTLYHLPTCASAKRIKPENIICFSSAEDAAARGYKPGCLK